MSTLCLKTIASPKSIKQRKSLLRTLYKETSTFEAVADLFTITSIHKTEFSNKAFFFFFRLANITVLLLLLLLFFICKDDYFPNQHRLQNTSLTSTCIPRLKATTKANSETFSSIVHLLWFPLLCLCNINDKMLLYVDVHTNNIHKHLIPSHSPLNAHCRPRKKRWFSEAHHLTIVWQKKHQVLAKASTLGTPHTRNQPNWCRLIHYGHGTRWGLS